MTSWVGDVVAASAALTAAGVLWRTVFQPAYKLANLIAGLTPMLKELVIQFDDVKQPFHVLEQIIAQFRTDSGSSLRDVIDRLEKNIGLANNVLATITASQTATKALNDEDRLRTAALTVSMAEMIEWRRIRQVQEVVESRVAAELASKADALAKAAAQVLSDAPAQQKAAAKVRRDNDTKSDLPLVQPTSED